MKHSKEKEMHAGKEYNKSLKHRERESKGMKRYDSEKKHEVAKAMGEEYKLKCYK